MLQYEITTLKANMPARKRDLLRIIFYYCLPDCIKNQIVISKPRAQRVGID